MQGYTPAGEAKVRELAERHGFSAEAVARMLDAVARGRGGMAQFDHPEFGGSGQWMRGGMTMIGDMFNATLKARVDRLCDELSGIVAADAVSDEPSPLFATMPAGAPHAWWPGDLGAPDSAGAQNDARYAYFAAKRRLAIDTGAGITVYDTLHHRISGVSQQQPGRGAVAFWGPDGVVDLASLPVVSGEASHATSVAAETPASAAASHPATTDAAARWADAHDAAARASQHQPQEAPPQTDEAPVATAPETPVAAAQPAVIDILTTIERLAELERKGILSAEEYAAKKTELLSRL